MAEAPQPVEVPSLAERFWQHAPGPETEELQEPARSAKVVENFLIALAHAERESGAQGLIAMLRRAEVGGDPSYASPEQLRGENLDVRAVVFSLGVVLFERLTGRHPFGAENNRPRRVERIRRGEMGSGVNSFPTIPGGLRTALVRAMSPFAEERFADLRELRAALMHSTSETTALRLPGASPQPEKPARPARASASPVLHAQPWPRFESGTPTAPPPVKSEEARPTSRMRSVADPEAPRRPVGLIAAGAAIGGAALTLAVVMMTRESPKPAAVASAPAAVAPSPALTPTPTPDPTPSPKPTPKTETETETETETATETETETETAPAAVPRPDPVPAPAAVPRPAPAPVPRPDPVPVPAPAPAPTAAASGGSLLDSLTAAVTPCLAPKSRVFGLSLATTGKSTVAKAYFGATDPLTPAERSCIGAAVKGLATPDTPRLANVELRASQAADGAVTLTLRKPLPH